MEFFGLGSFGFIGFSVNGLRAARTDHKFLDAQRFGRLRAVRTHGGEPFVDVIVSVEHEGGTVSINRIPKGLRLGLTEMLGIGECRMMPVNDRGYARFSGEIAHEQKRAAASVPYTFRFTSGNVPGTVQPAALWCPQRR